MQYLRARYYDPATGRFLSVDPVQAAEPYAYVGNNPANLIDPYGLFGLGDIKKAAGDIANAAVDVAKTAAPYAVTCASWGAVGFVGSGNLGGAAVGCAVGVGSKLWTQYVSDDPISQCAIWGLGAFVGPKFSHRE